MNWCKGLKARVLLNEPLSKHTSLRIGPEAALWVEPYDREALKSLIKKARAMRQDYLIIGFGSKLLINKKRIPLAIHLGSADFKKCIVEGNEIIAGAGVASGSLLKAAYENGLGGLEFLNGIPASVAGMISLNAGVGWPKRIEIGPFVEQVEVMDTLGRIKILDNKILKFGYRYSNLRPYIILSARFRLFKKRKKNIKIKMQRFLDYRKRSQDLGYPSAGCIFKNCNGLGSGRLIDLCGLKGKRVGGACISPRHANFIVNTGGATARDILTLMKMAQREVKKKFALDLEPEIEVI